MVPGIQLLSFLLLLPPPPPSSSSSDPHSPLRQLQSRITGARSWLDSGLAKEDEEVLEAESEAHMSFLAHGAGERGRTSDSIEAIEAQQAALRFGKRASDYS